MVNKCLLMVNATVSIFEYDILQIFDRLNQRWEDYASIKNTEDAMVARSKVLNGSGQYRIVSGNRQVVRYECKV